jgi:hypothetical protein
MKGYTGVRSTQDIVNMLAMQAQNTKDEEYRAEALEELWGIIGNTIVHSMMKLSQKPREKVLGESFLLFRKAALNFDPSLGVPLLAYVIQESKWGFASAYRKEQKHRKREPLEGAFYDDPEEGTVENSHKSVYPESINPGFYHYGQDVDGNCFRKNAILQIERIASKDKKLAAYFSACQKACSHGLACSDAEVARYMGRTRACTGMYRKKLIRLLADNGLNFDNLVATAA